MSVVIISLTSVLVIVVLGLWAHIKNPDNMWFIVAREWQTLIGALLGFVTLASMLIISDNYQQAKNSEQIKRFEISFLNSLSFDLIQLFSTIDQRYGPLQVSTDSSEKMSCMNYITLASRIPVIPSQIRETYSAYFPSYSVETIELYFATESLRNNYSSFVSIIGTENCVVDGANILDFLEFYHEEKMKEARLINNSVLKRLETLK